MNKAKIASLVILTIVLIALIPSLNKNQNNEGVGEIIIEETKEDTKALNSVSAIVFDYRGYDTLGEATVLFTAILGTAAILRKSKSEVNENEKKD